MNWLFWVLIEGNDDERFFELVIKPRLEEKYGEGEVKLWKYAEKTNKKVYNFLRSIRRMGSDYIFVTDIDSDPCVTARKEKKQARYTSIDSGKIIVVKKEIEGWYLAGLDAATCAKLGAPHCRVTDSIGKKEFDGYIPKKFCSKTEFMVEILGRFSIDVAKQKNSSFRYFATKYGC